ncbi:MAG: hypothetical protein AAGF12_02500, partial [Myxococcota bacterium]
GGEEFFLQYVINDVQTTHPIPAPVIRDTWMCLELGFNMSESSLIAGVGGVLQPPATPSAELEAAWPEANRLHVRGGLAGGAPAEVQMWLDDLVVSTERIPCPSR